jgi:hypothetical protein
MHVHEPGWPPDGEGAQVADNDETSNELPVDYRDGPVPEYGDEASVDSIDWHMLLLGLAGRVADAVVARCRDLLADGRDTEAGRELVTSIQTHAFALFEAELEFLRVAMGPTRDADMALSGIPTVTSGFALGYRFAARPPDGGDTGGDHDPVDRAAIRTAVAVAGARGLWRAWRLPTQASPSHRMARVFVVEADADADVIVVTGELQRAVRAAGQVDPQVEVYPTGFEPPGYLRLARSGGELLWSRTPDPGVRVAVLFDHVDPTLGPGFHADHPTVDREELTRLAQYLRRGEPLLVTTGRLSDVVDPARGRVVPMTFRTDGSWVWSDATTYYLEAYQLLPDPALVAHIRGVSYVGSTVDDVAMHRAMVALQAPPGQAPAWTFGR